MVTVGSKLLRYLYLLLLVSSIAKTLFFFYTIYLVFCTICLLFQPTNRQFIALWSAHVPFFLPTYYIYWDCPLYKKAIAKMIELSNFYIIILFFFFFLFTITRSIWKGPYISGVLLSPKQIPSEKTSNLKSKVSPSPKVPQDVGVTAPHKYYIWSRHSTILPMFVGSTNKNSLIYVYDGKKFTQVRVLPEMIGHKFGEFCLTRRYQSKIKK